MGLTKNGEHVAVKKLRDILEQPDLGHKQFQNEFDNLKKLNHQNIVQVLAFCYESEKTSFEYDGRMVQAETTHRALCFEYMHNGSLQNHLSDVHGVDWHTRYKIIKGTCQGLRYIHEELHYHLDLKPDNILLDKDMVPKIADFGLSRLVFGKGRTEITQSQLGTIGYQPPEYIDRNEISEKFDIFSLGVIMIRILSGPEDNSNYAHMAPHEIIDLVQRNWRKMLQAKWSDSLLEAYCHQVETCTQVALNCMQKDSKKRPIIMNIIHKLNETEAEINKLAQERCHEIVSKGTMQMTTANMKNDTNEILPYEHCDSHLMTGTRCVDKEIAYKQETLADVGEVLGRHEEKKKIVASLLESMMEKIIILPIYGIGGIGKTTFAQLIYTDNNFRSYSHVWVYVSPRFNLNAIVNSIISQLSEKEVRTNEGQVTHSGLTELLSDKKVLIVLDDLWEYDPFKLEDLRSILNPGKSINTIVLVTTRSESIAKKMCTNTLRPYKIESLTDGICWEIIKLRSSFECREDKEQLMVIGWDIARKCGGVALAAQSLGFMLKSMPSDQWMKVKDSDIWNESISEDASLPNHVLASLKLSYTNINELDLRKCFTYCSIFPKGQQIVKHELIHQWVSLGFIKRTRMHSIMQICENYIVKLIGLSFLQHSVSQMSVGGYVTLFTMHDLVHDLARLLMVDEILLGAREQGISGEQSRPYVLLTDCSKQLESSTSFPDKISALRFIDCSQIELHGHAFGSAKSLQVLDLSECWIRRLPLSVGQLDKLGYLNAPRIQSQQIPKCITKLSKLIYLNLSGSKMSALPESIGETRGLMHLDISNCRWIEELPESFINLRKLVHLDLSGCRMLRGVSKALVGLTNMQYLNLSRGNIIVDYFLFEAIDNLVDLRYLGLSWIVQRVMSDVLWMPEGPQSPEDRLFRFIGRICTLSHLEHLDLSNNCRIFSVPESIVRLTKLHTLDLSNCWHLTRLPDCMVTMDTLRMLSVSGCNNLDRSILSRFNKRVLALPRFVVHALDGESRTNISMLHHANIADELQISRLDIVKSSKEVGSIKLIEKQSIIDLKLEWTRDAQRSLEDVEVLAELVPPSTLKILEIKGYNSISFPSWIMDITLYLRNIIRITISDLPNCSNLPPLGQLPELEELVVNGMDSITTIGECSYGGTQVFPRLKIFHLSHMKNLEVWNTMYCSDGVNGVEEYMFPNLKKLATRDCPKLTLKQCPPRCTDWVIENSDNILLSSWGQRGETSASSSFALTDVEVTVRNSKVPFDQWRLFQHLRANIYLRIDCSTDLTCSSPELREFRFIKSLLLQDGTQQQLPKWLGGLVRLRKLHIVSWKRLTHLDESMRHLTSLQQLYLEKCSSIGNIPVWLGNLPVLKKLDIRECQGIMSLPEALYNKLTKLKHPHNYGSRAIESNLQSLIIIDCPLLEAWCQRRERQEIYSARLTDEHDYPRRMLVDELDGLFGWSREDLSFPDIW